MKVNRIYTKEGVHPYEDIEFEKRTTSIKEPDGTIVFEMHDVEVPKHWSQTASDILAQKYFRKAGVPKFIVHIPEKGVPEWLQKATCHPDYVQEKRGAETSSRQVFHRLAGCWTYWGWKEGYFDSEEDARIFYEEIIYMLAMQIFAPNSPQFFNTGLNWAYGITGPSQGHYYFDTEKNEVVKSEDSYVRPQPHACFIQKIEDHLVEKNGIMDTWMKEARLFKYGSGSGVNFSTLRGKGEPLEGGGVSSGLLSWLKIGDVSAGGIKSGGTTRRAAKMVIVDVDHPDIEEFIDWKVKEEEKVAALITGSKINKKYLETLLKLDLNGEEYQKVLAEARKAGVPEQYIQRTLQLSEQDIAVEFEAFNNDWQGEAYKTVSGQNSNNSVSVTDAFMKAVENNDMWNTVWRTGKSFKNISAKRLWDKICYSAWACADPGLYFRDNVNKWNTVKNDGEIRAANPCSEYIFLDDTACNLASLNLVKFWDRKTKRFDFDSYSKVSQIVTIILDISVSMAQFPSPEIALNSYLYRPLGLGYANLGGLLMRMGIPYGSKEALAWTSVLTAWMHFISYLTSSELSLKLGTFPRYLQNKESMKEVIKSHMQAFFEQEDLLKTIPSFEDLRECIEETAKYTLDTGFRNAFVTCIAPTGTIGLVMDCDTTGIEPDYALVKYKKLAGGGFLTIVNKGVEEGLETLEYTPEEVRDVCDYLLKHHTLEGAPHLEEEDHAVFACANDISYQKHLTMMAAAQPFLSGAISKTVNMPYNATIEDVSNAYHIAWKLGLKAIALYRDGSKLSQPLMSLGEEKIAGKEVITEQEEVSNTSKRQRLPSKRKGYTQKAKIAGQSLYIRTGEYEEGRLGEIFLDMHREGATMKSILSCFSIAVSLGLQHGVPLEEYVDAFTFTKFEPSGVVEGHDHIKITTSIIDYVFRDLGINYLGRTDLSHINGKQLLMGGDQEKEELKKEIKKRNSPGVKFTAGFTGNICPECHNTAMVKNGTCEKCTICGTTTGCS